MPTYEDGLREGFASGWNSYIKEHTIHAAKVAGADLLRFGQEEAVLGLRKEFHPFLNKNMVFKKEQNVMIVQYSACVVIGSVEDKINERVVRLDAEIH